MCGFIAAVDYDGDLNRIANEMWYRGLFGYEGYKSYANRKYQFAHRSLPFVDLNPETAIQPSNEDLPDLFVGEIFNYKQFGQANDIEAIRYVYNEFGLEGFHNFDGFWTYVRLVEDSLIGITDYLSQKPLYYRTDMDAMASEPYVLTLLKESTTDEVFMSNTIKWGYSPDGRTPWNEIKQVPPGHFVHKGVVRPYWDWSKIGYTDLYSDLVKATKLRLGGQRDVSVLLSGGLDSTIIHNIIRDVLQQDPIAIHVNNGEREYADMVNPNAIQVNLDQYITEEQAIQIHQSPVDLGSVMPQIAMGMKLKELSLHAVMTGDGADELFGGYRRAKQYDSQMSDVFCELPYYHLPKIDRTMMFSTIETRSPFLAPSVVKSALDLPYYKRNGEKKVLKEAFKELVPQKILMRDKLPLKTEAIRKDPMEQRLKNDQLWRYSIQ